MRVLGSSEDPKHNIPIHTFDFVISYFSNMNQMRLRHRMFAKIKTIMATRNDPENSIP